MNKLGTPKTLTEAVVRMVTRYPMSTIKNEGPKDLRDFLAQRFGVAYLNAQSEEEIVRLRELWESIVEGIE